MPLNVGEPPPDAQAAGSGALLPRNSGDDEEAGESGPLAGVCEAFLLIWCIPGFGYVSLFSGLLSGGATLAWIFVFPALEKQVWEGGSAANTAWMNAGRSLTSVLLCAHFGMWSDNHNRKIAVAVMAVASMCVGLPLLFLGFNSTGLYVVVALVVITGPFAVHVSGSPVLWAWASDYLGPEHKETGFAIIGACSSAGSFVMMIFAKWLSDFLTEKYPDNPDLPKYSFLFINLAAMLACLLIIVLAPPGPGADMPVDEPKPTDDVVEEKKGLMEMLFGPMRLVARYPTLRAACVVVALLTLPDIAAMDISSQILYSILGLVYPQDYQQMINSNNQFSTYPRPLVLVVVIAVGVCGRRYGPHQVVRVWVPITAILFSFPCILLDETLQTQLWAIIISGFFVLLPLTNYGPLQALVTHIVPENKVGEAMGALATCSNMVSLIAPLLVGAYSTYLDSSDQDDLLWTVYPACSFIMFLAWPFTFCLVMRVPRDSKVTWSTWASAARPSTIRSALNARSSAMYSARP